LLSIMNNLIIKKTFKLMRIFDIVNFKCDERQRVEENCE